MILARRINEVRVAVMMLTRLPVGRIEGQAPTLAQSSWAFPLVGLIVGGLGWGAHLGALSLGADPMVAALLAVVVLAVITGALHHDGLADFADGIGGGRDRDHCLEIMRDSRIGSYGVLALILAVGLQATALGAGHAGAAAFLFIAVGSRLAMGLLMVALPPARADGLGRMTAKTPALSLVPGAIVLICLGFWIGPAAHWVAMAMVGAVLAVGALAWRRIQGQTGDVLGAGQLLAEVAAWVTWSVVAL